MEFQSRINAFVKLGEIINNYFKNEQSNQKLFDVVLSVTNRNTWFTKPNVDFALRAIGETLTEEKLLDWTNNYPEIAKPKTPKKIGVVMAGNIPLVGFHDLLCVLISGNIFIGKLSSKDDKLMRLIADLLIDIDSEFTQFIHFEEDYLKRFDAVIATGSDNTSRYFDFYFGKYPNIIRKNRNSVAVLTGNETDDELTQLSNDIFVHFGLGCRNVSKLFLPTGYDLTRFLFPFEIHREIVNHNKYANNYDYNRAIYLVNQAQFLDSSWFMLKEENGLSSPVAVIYYEFYSDFEQVVNSIDENKEHIQCIVSHLPNVGENETVPFGKAQMPELTDYADNIDTMKFLCNLENITTE